MRRRLDAELVRRGLARSRNQAQELVAAGLVTVDGRVAAKPASQIDGAQAVVVAQVSKSTYVSRGGDKLAGALDTLAQRSGACPEIADQICLDAGASTGGFTDVLLRRGASLVHAVDVGYGQLAWTLRNDPRVKVKDRTNVRYLEAGDLDPTPALVVADLSFISLRQVLPALVAVSTPQARLLLMVKPQFEVGKQALPSGGVVSDPAARAKTVWQVAQAARQLDLGVMGVAHSPLPGPSGNHEFFLSLAKGQSGLSLPEVRHGIGQETGSDLVQAMA